MQTYSFTNGGIPPERIQMLTGNKIDLIALAGFMRVLSPEFVQRFKGRILNIHPSLLPAFKGEQGIKNAFDSNAVLKVFEVKGRPLNQALPVIVSGLDMAREIAFVTEAAEKLIKAFL
jgi:hypothetical protein